MTKRTLFWLAAGCLAGSVGWAAAGPAPWCDACAGADHSVHFPANGILHFAVMYTIPAIPDDRVSKLPTVPLQYDVTVDPHGIPCVVKTLDVAGLPDIGSRVESFIRQWRFNGGVNVGQSYCLRSKVLVYRRRSPGGVALVVPGLADPKGTK